MRPAGNGLFFVLLFGLLFSLPAAESVALAQDRLNEPSNSQPEEVFLSFNYENLFNTIVIAVREDGQYYLPVSAIFSALEIPHEVSLNPPVISGSYLSSENIFELNFNEYTASLRDQGNFIYDNTHMHIRETDFYITPEIFTEVFQLNFKVDFSNLVLRLETPHELPVLEEFRRARQRERQRRFTLQEEYYDLRFDRNRKMLSGGFLDYSLSANISDPVNSYSLNATTGIELLGGDLQGSMFGNYSSLNSSFTTDNLRWRYAWRNKTYLSKFVVGQTVTDGFQSRPFRGVSITNEPVEPRYIFDEFEIEGNAPPGSEVELYLNEALYDFQNINQNGRYRFLAPLSYGSSELRLRIYNPAGDIREVNRRIQIPFTYLPEGQFEYHLNAGQLENPIFGSTERGLVTQGDLGYGISKTFTQKVGFEYLGAFSDQTPVLYSSTSARVFEEYLLSLDAAPTAFYRMSANAIYASSASWNLNYTNYRGGGIYNTLNYDHEVNAGLFLPFKVSNISSGIRFTGNHSIRNTNAVSRYGIDMYSRMNRFNVRLRYSDTQTNGFSIKPTLSSELQASANYSFGRYERINRFFRGTFLRAGVNYNPVLNQVTGMDAQVARSIFENGRIQGGFSRNFLTNSNFFTLAFSIDLNPTRLSTSARASAGGSSLTQNVSGSIGFDDHSDSFVFSNRQQVGRAATAVRLYIDNNNSGTYDPEDELIKNNAVRISKSSISEQKSNGVIYLSQLRQYSRMNMEINKSAIQNPLLVPEFEQFSLVTDPNRYKPINIPFYVSGVISGQVNRVRNNTEEELAGIRVYLSGEDGTVEKEMQTFSDGSFYAYEIPPGQYNLYLDRNQLTFLDAVSRPDTLHIEVERRPEGDFIEGLNFRVISRRDTAETADAAEAADTMAAVDTATTADTAEKQFTKRDATVADSTLADKTVQNKSYYLVQLASFETRAASNKVANRAGGGLGESFYVIRNTGNGLFAIRSEPIFEQDQVLDKIRLIHKSYPGAGIVLMNFRADTAGLSDSSAYIELGTFDNRKQADDFAARAADTLGHETEVTGGQNNGTFRVILKNAGQLAGSKREQLASLLAMAPERPMKFRFHIIVNPSGETRDPGALASLKENIPKMDISEKEGNIIVINNISSWNRTLELRDLILDEYRALGYPVILLEEILTTGTRP